MLGDFLVEVAYSRIYSTLGINLACTAIFWSWNVRGEI